MTAAEAAARQSGTTAKTREEAAAATKAKATRFAQMHEDLCPWRNISQMFEKKKTPQACLATAAAAEAAARQSEATAKTKVAAAATTRSTTTT